MAGRLLGLFLIVGVLAFTIGASGCKKKTRLVIEMTGGFAYLADPDNDRLNVAYLDDVRLEEDIDSGRPGKEVVCEIKQIGTELKVLRGKIVGSTPSAPGQREFDLHRYVVTFPMLDNSNIDLDFDRKDWNPNAPSPSHPNDPHDPKDWENLQFLPAILPRHGSSTLNPGWPSLVNGYMSLRGGRVIGTLPSDYDMETARIDFKVNGTSQFSSSVTDKVVYTVNVPGTQIEMRITGPTTTWTVFLEPTKAGEPVKLSLKGKHAHTTDPSPQPGDELKDHCAFYSLLKDVPPYSTWLKPHFMSAGASPTSGGGQPSPGFFCNGDWF